MNDSRNSHSEGNSTSSEEKDEEMICALTSDERSNLRDGLNGLPDTMPPRAVWHRIREQAEAEGLLVRRASRRWRNWYAGAGLAAAAALVAVLVPRLQEDVPVQFPTVPDNREVSDLRALPSRPKVVRAGTQATILELEDRIAAIDYQLSDPQIRLTADEEEIFWRERVRLMKSLVRLRYAQAQRTAF